MSDKPASSSKKPSSGDDKQARLSAALRDNLFKRKAQARARAATQKQTGSDKTAQDDTSA